MEVKEYLSQLGWEANKWTVLKDGEWQPLTKVSGYQNHIFDAVKDPNGRQMFGKNARVVEVAWMNKHLASVNEVPKAEPKKEIPAPAPIPEPAKEEKKIPEVPTPEPEAEAIKEDTDKELKDRVEVLVKKGFTNNEAAGFLYHPDGHVVKYDDLKAMSEEEFHEKDFVPAKEEKKEEEVTVKEVAKASDNVQIVTMPKQEEAPEEEEEKEDWKAHVFAREKQLLKLRFKKDENDEEKLIGPDDFTLFYADLDSLENNDWTSIIKKYTALSNAKPGKEKELAAAQERQKERREADTPKKEESNLPSKEEIEAQRKEQAKKREELEQEKKQVEAKMTTGDVGGVIHAISKLGFGHASFSVNKCGDQYEVSVVVTDCGKTTHFDSFSLNTIKGNGSELDQEVANKLLQAFNVK